MGRPYILSFEEDGVYFEGTEFCTSADKDAALAYIKRKNIEQLKMDQVLSALEGVPRRVCIAPPQKEYVLGEQVLIAVSGDQMEAEITLLPPDEGGERLTFERIMEEAASNGVIYGIDTEAVRKVLELRPYGQSMCIAKGQLPEDGKTEKMSFTSVWSKPENWLSMRRPARWI
jgi:uncharacterized protein (DUF342 family)